MTLSVLERLLLLQILPAEGDFATLKIVRTLREELSFDEEELAQVNLKQEGGRMTWDNSVDLMKGFAWGARARSIIEERLKKMNDEKKLTDQFLSLYEQFVGE